MSPPATHNIAGSEAFTRRRLSPAVGAMTMTRRRGASLLERAIHLFASGVAVLAFLAFVIAISALMERGS